MKKSVISLLVLLWSSGVFALEIGKPTPIHPAVNHFANAVKNHTVYVMHVKLTPKENAAAIKLLPIIGHPKQTPLYATSYNLYASARRLPSAVNLGMNGVPVLDQGKHGSCVTFASTAALDAAIGKGDYISQLCQLELGQALEKESYMPSGWDGSTGPIVLNQMLRFGFINKEYQTTASCAGIKEYPTLDDSTTGNPMTEAEFKTVSENLMQYHLQSISLLNDETRLNNTYTEEDANINVMKVKQALASGNRAVIGTFLVIGFCGDDAGACGHYHAAHDTWLINDELSHSHPFLQDAHEMVIYGYDDNAIATDDQGKPHRGLFMLRNSWGTDNGDNGEYYMSYDFFKVFVTEIQTIQKNHDDV